jgi:nanoRNase/pAp phosphatase (c-di-AMP/oligoRNAs hydrolase)
LQVQKLTRLLNKINPELVLLLCHHNADPDAIGAAFAFSSLLKRIRPKLEVEIAAPGGASRLSKQLLKKLQLMLTHNPNFEDTDLIVLLDTNTVAQLDDFAEKVESAKCPIIVIDHHSHHVDTERLATLIIADENASSTCEIIYKIFADMKLSITTIEAEALFLGLAFDSRHFAIADSRAFKIAADLIDSGVKTKETLSLLSSPMDKSERVARLKASKRVELIEVGSWIMAVSHVSTHQASAARALIMLGAHLAIVAGRRGKKINVSMRASQDFFQQTRIHLGRELAQPLGEFLHGMGGGHSVSAGVNGTGDVDSCLKHSIKLIRNRITAK